MGFFGGRIGENMSEKSKVLVVDDKQVERVMMKRILMKEKKLSRC